MNFANSFYEVLIALHSIENGRYYFRYEEI